MFFLLTGSVLLVSGVFLGLWHRTVVRLPVRRRPGFSMNRVLLWTIPATSIVFVLAGMRMLYSSSPGILFAILVVIGIFAFLILRFDRYSAEAREIYDIFSKIRTANPSMAEAEVLFHTAEHRYPRWSQDRLLELVAGKDLENLILMMLIQENDIHPIADWDLYRSVRKKVSLVVRPG